MNTSEYVPNLARGTLVLFIGKDHHPKTGQQCTIIGALPNPSKRAENQWYDVRFDDYSMGRFVERYLVQWMRTAKRALREERKLMHTREIPMKQWGDFFESFSRRHENWLVQLEMFNSENAQQLSSQNLRLKSITAEPKANGREKMIVIVGEGETTEVSQLIRKPSRVLLTQNDVGADEGIEIDSDNTLVVIRFRSAILAELVDDVA